MTNQALAIETRGLCKRFGDVRANDQIDLQVEAGTVHGIVGENGAGKSTLLKMLFGFYSPNSGDILVNGEHVSFVSPSDAMARGVGMVHQHFMLVDPLTVTENIIMGMEPGRGGVIDYKSASKDVQELSDRYKLEIDPNSLVENLPYPRDVVAILNKQLRHSHRVRCQLAK